MEAVIPYILAFLLLGHGIAHLPGFIVSWQLGSFPDLPYRTTIFGASLNVGADGMRLIGLGWLGIAAALIALALAIAFDVRLWPWAAPMVLALSLLLCVAGWPEARLGVVANAVLAASLAGMRYGILT
jgi:hypothetical protein